MGLIQLPIWQLLDVEFEQLKAGIEDVATDTQWNGVNMLSSDAGAKSFQVGANASQTCIIVLLKH